VKVTLDIANVHVLYDALQMAYQDMYFESNQMDCDDAQAAIRTLADSIINLHEQLQNKLPDSDWTGTPESFIVWEQRYELLDPESRAKFDATMAKFEGKQRSMFMPGWCVAE